VLSAPQHRHSKLFGGDGDITGSKSIKFLWLMGAFLERVHLTQRRQRRRIQKGSYFMDNFRISRELEKSINSLFFTNYTLNLSIILPLFFVICAGIAYN